MGDADIILRHVTRRRPGELLRAFLPEGRVDVIGWVDTQVTKVERRLDKALRLCVQGEPRVLHVEFCFALREDLPDRVFEYQGFLFTALRLEAPSEPVPPIESVAVVLSGPRRRLPAVGKRRTSWPGRRFSGAHFRIDAVYQRTVAELRARGSLLWLAFTPLARDATAAAMREVVTEIRARTRSTEERTDLYEALLTLATIDPWSHHLHAEVDMFLYEEDEKEWLRCQKKAREEHARFVRRMQEREDAIAEILGRLFARRVGRPPTSEEERSIAEHAYAVNAGKVGDDWLDLEGDALLRWLAEPVRRS